MRVPDEGGFFEGTVSDVEGLPRGDAEKCKKHIFIGYIYDRIL
jgi:hypothetical protein